MAPNLACSVAREAMARGEKLEPACEEAADRINRLFESSVKQGQKYFPSGWKCTKAMVRHWLYHRAKNRILELWVFPGLLGVLKHLLVPGFELPSASICHMQHFLHDESTSHCLAAEAAKILDVTPATVRLREARGELPAERTESGVRIFKRVDVERLAAQREAARLARRIA